MTHDITNCPHCAIAGVPQRCPVPSALTGWPCILPAGHPAYRADRFHHYASPAAHTATETPDAAPGGTSTPAASTDAAWARTGRWAEAIAGGRALFHPTDDEGPVAT